MRRLTIILVAGLALGGGNPAAEMRHDFRQKRFNDQVVRLEGPTPSRYVKCEDAGLRIALPRPDGPKKPTGFTFQFVLRGDFEVTTSYEILKEELPPPGKSIGVTAYLMFDAPAQDGVTFGRLQRKDGPPVFTLNHMAKAEGNKRKSMRTEAFPAGKQSSSGTLRAARRGPALTLSAAAGRSDTYTDLASVEVGAADVKLVRVAADPDGTDTPIEVRIGDFRVRADELLQPGQAAATRTSGGTRAWLLWAVAGGAVLFAVTALAWAALRRRRASGKMHPTTTDGVAAEPGAPGAEP
ncbi:MAG TPA: DUF1583 domain-containing protein [Urbifossiella sp.]|nr:DUF1583 domain-containing protein [Urbifossiella sp.]